MFLHWNKLIKKKQKKQTNRVKHNLHILHNNVSHDFLHGRENLKYFNRKEIIDQ